MANKLPGAATAPIRWPSGRTPCGRNISPTHSRMTSIRVTKRRIKLRACWRITTRGNGATRCSFPVGPIPRSLLRLCLGREFGMGSRSIHKSHNVSVLMYHLVCAAKYRRVVMSAHVDEVLRGACVEIEKRWEIMFLEIGLDRDHAHFLIQSVPTYSPTRIVGRHRLDQEV